jgi:hypothetical protein
MNEENPTQKTQDKTAESMDSFRQDKEKLLTIKTGALSVLSYPPNT